jgi:hypothetical protein
VPSDLEIWRNLPSRVRSAALELISEMEKKLATSKRASSEEQKDFRDELRSALIVAVGVLEEAEDSGGADPYGRVGNA